MVPSLPRSADIQALIMINENQGDVIILGVAHPNESNPNTRKLDRRYHKVLEENGYTFPLFSMNLQVSFVTV